MDSRVSIVRRWATNSFLLVFLFVQLLLPLKGCRHDAGQTRGNFSWNMYAKVYRCSYRYEWVSRYGRVERIDIRSHFNKSKSATKVMHGDVLPVFHAYLRDHYAQTRPQGAVRATVRYSENGAPHQHLIPPRTWLTEPEGSP